MRWFRFAVFILIVTVLQASLLAHLSIKPDLLLILLVFFAVYCDSSESIITSFVIGFAADIIGSAMGSGIISFGILGTALANLHRVIAIDKMPYQSFAIFVTGLLAGALSCFLTFLKGQPAAPNMYAVLLWTPLCSAVVGPFLFLPCTWWMRIKKSKT